MVPYNRSAISVTPIDGIEVASFVTDELNADRDTVRSFGDEWNRFASFTEQENQRAGDQYFDLVTPEMANANTIALDLGCGTGRWSKYLSPRVRFIEAVDPGEAVRAAAPYTASCQNVRITRAGYGGLPFEKGSFDFVFSLGVVHHLPDTDAAICEAVSMLKGGGWLLLYIYYSLDNRSRLYRALFAGVRSPAPEDLRGSRAAVKFLVCEAIAVVAYGPFVAWRGWRVTWPAGKAGQPVPLSVLRGQALEGHPQRLTRSLRHAPRAALLAGRQIEGHADRRRTEGHQVLGPRAVLARRRTQVKMRRWKAKRGPDYGSPSDAADAHRVAEPGPDSAVEPVFGSASRRGRARSGSEPLHTRTNLSRPGRHPSPSRPVRAACRDARRSPSAAYFGADFVGMTTITDVAQRACSLIRGDGHVAVEVLDDAERVGQVEASVGRARGRRRRPARRRRCLRSARPTSRARATTSASWSTPTISKP